MSSSGLTEEQLKRIEENRKRALALKEAHKKSATSVPAVSTIPKTAPAPQPTTNNGPAPTLRSPPGQSNPSTNKPIVRSPPNLQQFNYKNSNSYVPSSSASSKPVNSAEPATIPGQLTGKCVYLDTTNGDHSRFEVAVGFSKPLIDLFKSMKSKRYEPETKRWSFSVREYDELMFQVKMKLGTAVKLEPLERHPTAAVAKTTQAKFTLSDRNRFEVQSEFKPELKAIFDSISSRKYDPNSKKYSFELKDYDELLKKISDKFTRGEVSVVGLPKAVREVFKEQFGGKNPPRFDSSFDLEYLRTRIDPTIHKSLLPFQVEGICFAVQQNGRLLLADDMGLGKTIQGLAIASYYKSEWPLFIVVPSSVKFMWKESCKKWLTPTIMEVCRISIPELIDNYIQVIENGRQPIDPKCKIVISSYDLLAKNVETISKVHYKIIIADESHLLKNTKTARTKSAVKLIQNCNRVILLSGTPALSRPSELYAQIHAINPSLFNTFHEFGMRYCAAKETKFGWDYSGYSNMSELKLLLEEKLLIRREKKDVIQQLPTKMREKVQLDPNLIEQKSKTLIQASQRVEEPHMKGSDKRSAVIAYFQETCKAKFRAVCQYVSDLIESGKKFLVFAHHQMMLDEVEKECQNAGAGYIRIDGSTQSETRQYMATRFQNEDECRVAILSITAASSGLTLTKANLVVFAELFWNPGILVQAEDRVYRIGQKDSVMIQYLYAKGTADDKIWPLVNEKLNVLSKAGLTKEILSEAKNIAKNDNQGNNPNSIANIFKELIDMELAQNQIKPAVVDNLDEENSLPGLSIEEVNLNSPKNDCGIIGITTGTKKSLPEDDIDDEDLFVCENQLKLDRFFSKSAPPSKKIKQ